MTVLLVLKFGLPTGFPTAAAAPANGYKSIHTLPRIAPQTEIRAGFICAGFIIISLPLSLYLSLSLGLQNVNGGRERTIAEALHVACESK